MRVETSLKWCTVSMVVWAFLGLTWFALALTLWPTSPTVPGWWAWTMFAFLVAFLASFFGAVVSAIFLE